MRAPAFATNHVTVYEGHVVDVLGELASESIDCVVTSPPYWGLRAYGTESQVWGAWRGDYGLEPTPELYVEHTVAVFREVRRVLRAAGTLWLNLGDSYASHGGPGWQGKNGQRADRRFTAVRDTVAMREIGRHPAAGLKPKDMVGIPWRVAFALQADGWYLRSDIIWSKPNPMPESVMDRPTKSHEYLFLLSKSGRYYYDADAIRTPLAPKTFTTFGTTPRGYGDGSGLVKSENWAATVSERRPRLRNDTARNGDKREARRTSPPPPPEEGWESEHVLLAGANARSVWEIATQPYPQAHFATFPEELPRRCIKAGCPADGIVLDPFAGSGTTLAVARDLGRRSIGIELKTEYLDLIRERCKQEAFAF